MSKSIKTLLTAAMVLLLVFGGSLAATAQTIEVAVIVKATDSDFWQVVLRGAETAGQELENVNVRTYGPTSEADIAEQVAILENVVTSGPDAIVIASTSSDATVPALERAFEQGIKIILVDNLVHTESYHSFLATDNVAGGALAAEQFVAFAEAMGKSLDGKVGMISSMAGVQVLIDRNEGFVTRIAELALDLELLSTRYVDNRIHEALAAAEDIIISTPDIVGFFADNNHTGVGVARAVEEAGLEGEIVLVAYDADPEQVRALQDGSINALVVQDPFGMGYEGVHSAIRALDGEELPRFVDTGATAVTAENFDDPEVQMLMFPDLRAESILGQ